MIGNPVRNAKERSIRLSPPNYPTQKCFYARPYFDSEDDDKEEEGIQPTLKPGLQHSSGNTAKAQGPSGRNLGKDLGKMLGGGGAYPDITM